MGCGPTEKFSRRERAAGTPVKKPTIARAQRSAGTACSALRHRSFGLPAACADHIRYSTTPARRAFCWNHAPLGSRPAPRAAIGTTPSTRLHYPERASCTTRLRTTPCTTGFPHHAPSYHTVHHGHLHDGAGTTGVQDRGRLITSKRGCRPRSPDAERIGIQVPRARCPGSPSKSNDLAREAVSWYAVLGC